MHTSKVTRSDSRGRKRIVLLFTVPRAVADGRGYSILTLDSVRVMGDIPAINGVVQSQCRLKLRWQRYSSYSKPMQDAPSYLTRKSRTLRWSTLGLLRKIGDILWNTLGIWLESIARELKSVGAAVQ